MNSESECSETENFHAFLITALADMLDIICEEPDGNLLFRLWAENILDLHSTTSKLEKFFLTIFSIIVECLKAICLKN